LRPDIRSGTRFTLAYRYFLPLAAEVILALAELALLVDWWLGLYALPVFHTLMVIVGTQDAVDLLFGTSVAGRPGDGLFQVSGDDAMAFNDDVEPKGSAPDSGLDGGAPHFNALHREGGHSMRVQEPLTPPRSHWKAMQLDTGWTLAAPCSAARIWRFRPVPRR
jgi:hypothetical protein